MSLMVITAQESAMAGSAVWLSAVCLWCLVMPPGDSAVSIRCTIMASNPLIVEQQKIQRQIEALQRRLAPLGSAADEPLSSSDLSDGQSVAAPLVGVI